MSRISTLAHYLPSLSSLLVIFLVECMSSPASSAPLTIRYRRPLDRVRGSPSFLPLRTIHTKTRAYVQLAYLSRHYPINFHNQPHNFLRYLPLLSPIHHSTLPVTAHRSSVLVLLRHPKSLADTQLLA
jgi:hypothetical protein